MHILWQKKAVSDLHHICAYIRHEHPAAAEKTGAAIEASVRNLSRYPELGRIGEEAGTRELIVSGTPYFIVYRIRSEVQVLRILHGKQKWPV